MKRDWLWDRKISSSKLRQILRNPEDPEYIRWTALLLSRKNIPREVFSKYIRQIDFCRKWSLIKKAMRKDRWNNPRIVYWQAIYEKLLEKYRREGKKVFIKKEKKPASKLCQEIGGLIMAIRKREDLTQKALADKLGVSQQLISRIEKGYENVSIRILEVIAGSLKSKIKIDIQ